MEKSDFRYAHEEGNIKQIIGNSCKNNIIRVIINFLTFFISETVAKRIIIAILTVLNGGRGTEVFILQPSR
jgi:hypothetical protein